jgi:hypothetical protein
MKSSVIRREIFPSEVLHHTSADDSTTFVVESSNLQKKPSQSPYIPRSESDSLSFDNDFEISSLAAVKVPEVNIESAEDHSGRLEESLFRKKKRSNSTDISHDRKAEKKSRTIGQHPDNKSMDEPKLTKYMLQIKGVPAKATKEEVVDFFVVNCVNCVTDVNIAYDSNGRSKGSAVITISGSQNALQSALSLNGRLFLDTEKVVKIAAYIEKSKSY